MRSYQAPSRDASRMLSQVDGNQADAEQILATGLR
jgi:hypothetical protein